MSVLNNLLGEDEIVFLPCACCFDLSKNFNSKCDKSKKRSHNKSIQYCSLSKCCLFHRLSLFLNGSSLTFKVSLPSIVYSLGLVTLLLNALVSVDLLVEVVVQDLESAVFVG